ncbi:MAG: murein biosynthesis integral membrane protein MurJ [Chloroflexota bacterium]
MMNTDPTIEVLENPTVALPLEQHILDEDSAETVRRNLARATTILAMGNIASRVLGFAKEILLSNYFGAGRLVDAFQIAITVPQDLFDLAINGHVNSALVPVLSEYATKEDRHELWRLSSALLGLVCLGTSSLVFVLIIFAPQIITLYRGANPGTWAMDAAVRTLAPQFPTAISGGKGISAEAFALSVRLMRLTAPALIFQSLFSVVSGLLYALKRFTWPAFAAALFNGTIVVTMVVLAPKIGIESAAIGFLLGAVLQLALQFGGLRGERIRLQVRGTLSHPGVRRIGRLYLPVMLSLLLDIFIRIFSYNLASQAGDGNIAYMNWATSLREFPLGLVGTAISIAILPTLARQALRPEAMREFQDTLGQGIRLALVLIIPATVGMFALAGPLIGLVFERGAFTAVDTNITSIVLRLYLVGIPFAAVDLLLIFAFYARKDTLTPALVGVFSLVCYILIALLLRGTYGFLSLMIADSLKHVIHMTTCMILLRRRLGGLGSQRLPITLLKVALATTAMALITYVLVQSARQLWPVEGLTQRAIIVLMPSAFGAATYFILASLLQLNDFTWFIQSLRRKIRR